MHRSHVLLLRAQELEYDMGPVFMQKRGTKMLYTLHTALKLTQKSMEDKALYFPKLHLRAQNLNNLCKKPFSLRFQFPSLPSEREKN